MWFVLKTLLTMEICANNFPGSRKAVEVKERII
jgi:hypothetical protein